MWNSTLIITLLTGWKPLRCTADRSSARTARFWSRQYQRRYCSPSSSHRKATSNCLNPANWKPNSNANCRKCWRSAENTQLHSHKLTMFQLINTEIKKTPNWCATRVPGGPSLLKRLQSRKNCAQMLTFVPKYLQNTAFSIFDLRFVLWENYLLVDYLC